MVDLTGALVSMVELLLVAVVGFAASKLGYLDGHTNERLTKLLLNITLPAMIIASVCGLDSAGTEDMLLPAFGLSAFQFFALLATGFFCAWILRARRSDWNLYAFMSVATNTGFIGMAVATAIYGQSSVIFSSIFIMVIAVFVYSVGFGLMAVADPQRDHAKKIAIPWRSMINPSVVASIIAIVIFLLRIPVPEVVSGTLSRVGGITSTIAMLIVGSIMAGADVAGVFGEWRLYPYILIRQFIVPALLYLVLRMLFSDTVLLGVFVVMFAMPVGSMAPSFAAQFHSNVKLAANATVLSTLASFLAIPALVMVMTVA